MFRNRNLPNQINRNVKEQQDVNEVITMENVIKYQQHKFNPREPLFLSVQQFEELCKTTYDGSVPFTITAIVGEERKEEKKEEEIIKEDNISVSVNNEPEYPAPNANVEPEPYVYKKSVAKKSKR